jgi:hypothetical protein
VADLESTQIDNRIVNRALAPPGVISTEATRRQIRRLSRLSTGRLPLLSAVQRRWMRADGTWQRGSSDLPYARAAFSTESSSLSVQPAPLLPVVSARPVSDGDSPPGAGDQVVRTHVAPSEAAQSGAGRPSAPGHVLRTGQMPLAASRDVGTRIVQRYEDGPVGRAARREIVSTTAQLATGQRSVIVQAQTVATPNESVSQPAAAQQSVSRPDTSPPLAAASGERGTALARGTLVRQTAVQRDLDRRDTGGQQPPGPPGEPTPTDTRAKGSTPPVRGQAPAENLAALPAVLRRRGTVNLQRTLVPSPPTGHTGSAVGPPPVIPPLPTGQTARRRTRAAPLASEPAELASGGDRSAPASGAAQTAASGERKTVVVRRAPARQHAAPSLLITARSQGSAGRTVTRGTVRRQPTAAGEPDLVLSQRSQPAVSLEPGSTAVALPPTAGRAGLNPGQIVQRASPVGSGAGPNTASATGLESASPTASLEQRARGGTRPFTPLLQASEHEVVRAVPEHTMPAMFRPAIGGGSTDLILQRAVASSPPAAPAAGPAPVSAGGESPASAPAEPEPPPSETEGPDLERLADQVMAIIERRLIVQRESLGL